jgi:HD-GYP domain-containing protein (c-di-GMP phosphodiesterase class II)
MRRSGFRDVLSGGTGNHRPMDDLHRHGLRTAWLAARLAGALGLDPATTEAVRGAALTHDIGKQHIAAPVLDKPGRLDPLERRHIEMHSVLGAWLLMGREPQRRAGMAVQVALLHHEWWNGMGYPFGLAGTAIPLAARIVAVADVFDALMHERVYKPAWPRVDVLRYLRTQRGRQFDPACADAMHTLGRTLPDDWSAQALAEAPAEAAPAPRAPLSSPLPAFA